MLLSKFKKVKIANRIGLRLKTLVNFSDHYKLIGVERTATTKEIKKAFNKLAKQNHPDLHPDKAEAFKKINDAYQVLSDPTARKSYDDIHFHNFNKIDIEDTFKHYQKAKYDFSYILI